jgi:aspartyl-tRNA(Asn)/glutamyl-tRNA(Gln) amidotransferase subunit A
MRDYHDVRMVIAECELLANHQAELARRAGDFGAEFLRKVLPGCLFQGADYVQAQRARRVMLEELQPVYRDCDILLTAASGPAPRLDQFNGLDFWSKPSIFNLFNVSGGPALAICNGFAGNGLPLGMQIAAAPYHDAAVLRAGHAYEKATTWRTRRPRLQPGAVVPAWAPPPEPAAHADPALLDRVEMSAQRAGLPLDARSHAMLLSAAPYALAMAERIHRTHARSVEPAAQFGFPR